MSEGEHGNHDSSQEKLAALRRELEQGRSPEGFVRLVEMLDLMKQPERRAHDEAEEEAMLAHLISAALDGVDIPRRYPHYFQRLLDNPELRAAFLDGLAILEEGPSPHLPLPVSHDLDFLNASASAPLRQEASESSGRLIRWRRPANEIAGLFSFLSASPLPTLREAAGFLEDETVTLLRGKLTSREVELDVTLEATRPAEQPDELRLSLWVLAANQNAALRSNDFALLATVTWGSYETQVTITGDGHYPLPTRDVATVVDDFGKSGGDLSITVQQKV